MWMTWDGPVSLLQMGYRLCSAIEGRAGMQENVRPACPCPQRQRREGLESRSISGQVQQMGRGAVRQKALGLSWVWGLRGQVDCIIYCEELLCTTARLCGRWDALGNSTHYQGSRKRHIRAYVWQCPDLSGILSWHVTRAVRLFLSVHKGDSMCFKVCLLQSSRTVITHCEN